MALYRESMVDIDLAKGSVFRSFINNSICEGNNWANRFGVNVFRNGKPVNISGSTVTGYFVRADGQTIVFNGVASGNNAYVSLPANCYAVEGNFTLAINCIGSTVNGTMRVVDGTVIHTTTENIVDPGGAVPDIEELTDMIERAESAAEEIAGFSITTELIEDSDYTLVITTE